MPGDFKFDVFLSHSSQDKPVVRDLARRLTAAGLRVWFDESQIRPAERSEVPMGLIGSLCMSAAAFGSDWSQLESHTFRFRDPLNKDRRFIPLRLDDAHIKGSFAQFLYINWLPEVREEEYTKLLESCRLPQTRPTADQEVARGQFIIKVQRPTNM